MEIIQTSFEAPSYDCLWYVMSALNDALSHPCYGNIIVWQCQKPQLNLGTKRLPSDNFLSMTNQIT
jgi:hypothetical protein